jgi:glycosyltransferase involved in cell wall biosynthesis
MANDADIVDVLMLCRPHARPTDNVVASIRSQRGVKTRLHVHTGAPKPSDTNRWQTIARARNEIKRNARSKWAMFVDDDVVLAPDCIRTLLGTLKASPTLGAIAADTKQESQKSDWNGHVSMAACLFRNQILQTITFRSTDQTCECGCCCFDLRSTGVGIAYCQNAVASEIKLRKRPMVSNVEPRILAAFDRRDIPAFEHQFLSSLRQSGNNVPVIAIGYGLYPSEAARISRLPNVKFVGEAADGSMVPIRRLHSFAEVTRRLPAQTPVAYWDVADVVFQKSLEPLWSEVRQQPNKLRAVIEPKSYPYNRIIRPWSLSIEDMQSRSKVFELLKANPFLNSGFAASTAATLTRYFDEAHRMRHGRELKGSSDWGDQMCLNVYCHTRPRDWQPISQMWNYCVHDRPPGYVVLNLQGKVSDVERNEIAVVHGNARSLRFFANFAK